MLAILVELKNLLIDFPTTVSYNKNRHICRKIRKRVENMGKKGDTTKATIRKAALILFVQKGFKDVTMKDICEATGLSRGGLYMHYGSTKQIFADVINEIMSGLKNEVAVKIENNQSATVILDELLERYQSEMLDRSGSLGLAFYEYYSGIPLSDDNAMLKQYYISKEMISNLIQYGINKGEFKQVNINAVVDLLLFSYQGVRMLSSIMPLDDDEISIGIISEIRAMVVK